MNIFNSTSTHLKPNIFITSHPLTFLFPISVDVDFCGYTITHPSESKINLRIQTRGERIYRNCAYNYVILLLCVCSSQN